MVALKWPKPSRSLLGDFDLLLFVADYYLFITKISQKILKAYFFNLMLANEFQI